MHNAGVVDDEPLMYGSLAGWFHLLTPPADYASEAAEVRQLLGAYAQPPLRRVLELGSGGGNLASHLAQDVQLTLTDPAPGMLEISRTINPDVEHLEGDMRTLRLARTFDGVIAHDAIGYMRSEAELAAAIETACVHLRPGGAAIFMPDWVLDGYVPATEHGGSDDGPRGLRYLEWDRPVEPDGHTVKTDYVIVTRDGAEVNVHHDVHELGIFPRATWLRLLEGAGFEPHRLVGGEGLDIFVGVKPAETRSPEPESRAHER
jgi:SAM-dependent methyltransferase